MNNQYSIDIISSMAERTIRKLWVIIILLIVLLVVTNGIWIYYENSFVDVVTESYSSESGDSGLAIVNRDGSVINYGESVLHPDENANP